MFCDPSRELDISQVAPVKVFEILSFDEDFRSCVMRVNDLIDPKKTGKDDNFKKKNDHKKSGDFKNDDGSDKMVLRRLMILRGLMVLGRLMILRKLMILR